MRTTAAHWVLSLKSQEAWKASVADHNAGDLPDDLFKAMEFVRNLDCCWLLLDQSGDTIEDLPTFDW